MILHSPVWLALTPLLIIGWLWAMTRRPPTLLVSNTASFREAGQDHCRRRWLHPIRWPQWLLGLGTLLLVLAMARPQTRIEHETQEFAGVDMMLVLDLSGSMRYLYDEVAPAYIGRPLPRPPAELGLESRIEIARRQLERFITIRQQDRLGLVAFARHPYLVSPLTHDHQFLIDQLHELQQAHLPDGTEIAAAIAAAVDRLRHSQAPEKVIVLFSDGEDNVPFAITPRQAARLAAEFGITIHTVGLGGDRVFALRNTLRGPVLQPSDETFDQPLLEDMAEITGGQFFRARDEETFDRVIEEMERVTTFEFELPIRAEHRENFLLWSGAGLALLLLGLMLENTFCRTLP